MFRGAIASSSASSGFDLASSSRRLGGKFSFSLFFSPETPSQVVDSASECFWGLYNSTACRAWLFAHPTGRLLPAPALSFPFHSATGTVAKAPRCLRVPADPRRIVGPGFFGGAGRQYAAGDWEERSQFVEGRNRGGGRTARGELTVWRNEANLWIEVEDGNVSTGDARWHSSKSVARTRRGRRRGECVSAWEYAKWADWDGGERRLRRSRGMGRPLGG
jgi:hypothetical protein